MGTRESLQQSRRGFKNINVETFAHMIFLTINFRV